MGSKIQSMTVCGNIDGLINIIYIIKFSGICMCNNLFYYSDMCIILYTKPSIPSHLLGACISIEINKII